MNVRASDSSAEPGVVDESGLKADYVRDGFVVVRGLIDVATAARVRADVESSWDSMSRVSDRIQDLWRTSAAVRALAANPAVVSTLGGLYSMRPIPFQTLNFRTGTEQPLHADSMHFDTVPGGLMCGAWVALEHVTEGQGPLRLVPGSQRLPALSPEEFQTDAGRFDDGAYELAVCGSMADAAALGSDDLQSPREITATTGDVVIWAATTLHGGSPIRNPNSTRWSQVTHYVFEGAPVVTPQRSRPSEGRWRVRDPLLNLATGRSEPLMARHRPVMAIPAGEGLHRLVPPSELSWWQRTRSRAHRSARRLGIRCRLIGARLRRR